MLTLRVRLIAVCLIVVFGILYLARSGAAFDSEVPESGDTGIPGQSEAHENLDSGSHGAAKGDQAEGKAQGRRLRSGSTGQGDDYAGDLSRSTRAVIGDADGAVLEKVAGIVGWRSSEVRALIRTEAELRDLVTAFQDADQEVQAAWKSKHELARKELKRRLEAEDYDEVIAVTDNPKEGRQPSPKGPKEMVGWRMRKNAVGTTEILVVRINPNDNMQLASAHHSFESAVSVQKSVLEQRLRELRARGAPRSLTKGGKNQ